MKMLIKHRPMLLTKISTLVVLGIGSFFVEESFFPYYFLGSIVIMVLIVRSVLLNHWEDA